MKNVGIGCGVFIVVAIILILILPSDFRTSILVYAMLFSLPLFIIGHFVHGYDHWKWLVWGVFWIFCAVLTCLVPLDTTETDKNKTSQTVTEEKNTTVRETKETKESKVGEKTPLKDRKTLEQALSELDALIGLNEVKAEVHKLVDFALVAKEREKQGLKVAKISYHCVFTGSPGTGKTTVARILGDIYRELGILKSGHLVETDRSGLVGEYVGETAQKTNRLIDSALDGVLFIDEAYALSSDSKSDYGAEAIATLLKRMEDDRERLVVIVAGYPEEMKSLLDANSGLRSRFNRYIHFPDYSANELAAIFRLRAKQNQFILSPDLESGIDKIMVKAIKHKDRQFGNGRFVRNLFESAVECQATRLATEKNLSKEQLITLSLADVDSSIVPSDQEDITLEQALAELDQLIGMKNVKAEVQKIAHFCQIAKEREDAGMKNTSISYHYVFTGNPGTGKTTVARVLAKI